MVAARVCRPGRAAAALPVVVPIWLDMPAGSDQVVDHDRLFAAWAVIVGSLGLRSESFGNARGVSTAIIGVSILLAAATGFAVIYVSN